MLFDDEYTQVYHYAKNLFQTLRNEPKVMTISANDSPVPLGKLVRQLKGYGVCILSFSDKSITVTL